jgi:hypothetical protein
MRKNSPISDRDKVAGENRDETRVQLSVVTTGGIRLLPKRDCNGFRPNYSPKFIPPLYQKAARFA